MPKKSLIIYASWTGNTEKVALRFKKVFDKYGWACDVLKVTKQTDVHNPPYYLDDYDLLCVGSPIISGIPVKEIYDDHRGILMPQNLFRGKTSPIGEFDTIKDSWRSLKGIAFVTYGGTRWGPPEALPSLACLQNRLEDMRVKCIGQFACAGGAKGGHGHSLDKLANAKGWALEDAASLVQRYMDDPDHPEFAALSAADVKLLKATAAERQKEMETPDVLPVRPWHWDIANRPSERDLTKAEIFLEEIVEDYYGGGVAAAPMAQYVCIA